MFNPFQQSKSIGVRWRPKKRLRQSRHWLKTASLGAALWLSSCLMAVANPSGPQIRHGQVHITPGAQTQIQQLTDKAIIDWQSFSIGANEAVRFLQPGQVSVILNRVVGQDPSNILGRLEANGNVFLINPNGILFGPGSVVNVGGLVASTLSITDEDFLSGQYSFTQDLSAELAAVVNQGTITVTEAGFAVLTGPTVLNEGTIIARSGKVTLAAGEQATLDLEGRDLVHFALGQQTSEGTVLLAPGMMSDTLCEALGVHSQARADRMVRLPDGSVRLENSSGTLVHAGTVSVDGSAQESAGTITLDSTDLTLLSSGSVTTASGQGQRSDGGEIFILSHLDGSASSRGFTEVSAGAQVAAHGGETGDGGFLEVSGDLVTFQGSYDLSAINGNIGHFLLDPILARIIDGAPGVFANPVTMTTDITDAFLENQTANFTLESLGDILFDVTATSGGADTGVDFSLGAVPTPIAVTLLAGTDPGDVGSIDLGSDTLTGITALVMTADGSIDFGSGSVITSAGVTANATNGSIDFATATVTTQGPLVANASQGVNFNGSTININSLDTNPLNVDAGAGIDLGSATINVQGTGPASTVTFDTSGGDINFTNAQLNTFGASTGRMDVVVNSAANILATNPNFQIRDGNFTLNSPTGDTRLGSGTYALRRDAGNFSGTLNIMGVNVEIMDSRTQLFGVGALTANIIAEERITHGTSSYFQNSGDLNMTATDLIDLGFSGGLVFGTVTLNVPGSQLVTGGVPQVDEMGVAIIDPTSGNLDLGGSAGTPSNWTAQGGGFIANVGHNLTGDDHEIRANGGDVTIRVGEDVQLGRFFIETGDNVLITNDTTRVHNNTGDMLFDNLIVMQDTGPTNDLTIRAGRGLHIVGGDIFVNTLLVENGQAQPTVAAPTFPLSELRLGSFAGGATGLTIRANNSVTAQGVQFSSGNGLTVDADDINITMSSNAQLPMSGSITLGGNSIFRPVDSMTLNSTTDFNPVTQELDSVINGPGADLTITGHRVQIRGLSEVNNATITARESVTFDQGGLKADNVDIAIGRSGTQPNALVFNGDVTSPTTDVLRNAIQANDIDIFGFLTGMAPSPFTEVQEGVRLNLGIRDATQTFIDVSVHSGGDTHIQDFSTVAGLGTTHDLVVERLGIEGSGAGSDSAGIMVQNGDLTIIGPGGLVLGKGGPDGGPPESGGNGIIESFGPDKRTLIDFPFIRDRNDGTGIEVVDIRVSGLLEFTVRNEVGERATPEAGLDISAADLKVDGSAGGGVVSLKLVENTLLELISTNLDFQGIDKDTNQVLNLTPGAGPITLDMALAGTNFVSDNVLVRQTGNLVLDDFHLAAGKNLGIQLTNDGNLISAAGSGPGAENITSAGSVALITDGNIGTQADPIFLTGGTVSGQAGVSAGLTGTVFIESTGPLTVGTTNVVNEVGTAQLTGTGLQADGDITLGVRAGNLDLQSPTNSATGIAYRVDANSLTQGGGGTITAPEVVFDVMENVGLFDTVTDTEVLVNATNIVLDVGEDALVRRTTGDVVLAGSADVGGTTYNATGAGQDLRVRADLGNLTVNTLLTVGQDAALVTGTNLTINPQVVPNSIFINGGMQVTGNLNLVSAGGIFYQAGLGLVAPNLGLGYVGTLSPDPALPIQVNQLSIQPASTNVLDPNGFTAVNQVLAVGTAVNSGAAPPPPDPPPPITPPPITPPPITPPPIGEGEGTPAPQIIMPRPDEEFDSSPLSQNNTDQVEDDIDLIIGLIFSGATQDPTVSSWDWFDEEDFLRRKFRR